jgi:hypothetical protein
MVPCAAMRFALAHPRRFEDQPGLPRRPCVFWGFLIEGPLLIERFVRNPYANAQYDCGCPGTPSPLNALYPAASPPRIRIPSGTDEAAKKAAAIHRLVAQDMERPLVPRQVGRVFDEASNAQLRASLRVCGVIPQHEFHDNRAMLVAAYLKAPMVLSNVAQCAHLSGQTRWCDAQIGASTILSDGDPYEFYPDCLVYGGESAATQVAVSQLPPGVVAAAGLSARAQWGDRSRGPFPDPRGASFTLDASPSLCSSPCEPCDGIAVGTASGQPAGGPAA